MAPRVNVLPHADIDAFIAATAAGEVTWTSSSFTMMRELIACLEGGRRFERGRLRYVRVASGRLEAAEMDRLEELLGVPVRDRPCLERDGHGRATGPRAAAQAWLGRCAGQHRGPPGR
jgi:hypothetical protein